MVCQVGAQEGPHKGGRAEMSSAGAQCVPLGVWMLLRDRSRGVLETEGIRGHGLLPGLLLTAGGWEPLLHPGGPSDLPGEL